MKRFIKQQNDNQNKKNFEYCGHMSMLSIITIFFSKIHPQYQNITMFLLALVSIYLVICINKSKNGSKLTYSIIILLMLMFVIIMSKNNFYMLFEYRKNIIYKYKFF